MKPVTPTPTVDRLVFLRALIEALRSGNYTQARGQLRVTDEAGNHSYCCLGVACVVGQTLGIENTHFFGPARGHARAANLSDEWAQYPAYPTPGNWCRPYFSHPDLPESDELVRNPLARNPLLQIPPSLTYLFPPDNLTPSAIHASVLNDRYQFNFLEIADCFEYTYLPDDYAAHPERHAPPCTK